VKPVERYGTEVLDASDSGDEAEDRGLADVDVEHGLASTSLGGGRLVATSGEQLEQLGGAGQPAEGDRPQLVAAGVLRMAGRDEVGDPLQHRVDPDGVTRSHAGDDVAEAVLVGLGQCDVAPAALSVCPGCMGDGVCLDDLAWASVRTRLGASVAMIAATARSTMSIVASGTDRLMLATLRATQTSASRAMTHSQVSGNRCWRSSASAMADWQLIGCTWRTIASSAMQNS
jgi:hypothetical protein